MISRLLARLASIALMLCLVPSPVPAGVQELSTKELKKAVKQAGSAFGAGRYDQALELYDRILTSTSGADARRGEALFASVVIRLSATAGHRNLVVAKQHLEQLEAFPRHPERVAIAALSDLFSGLDSVRADGERRVAELEEQAAAYQIEREQAAAEAEQAAAEAEEAAGESEAAGGRVRSLESKLRKVRAELAECQAELETKEQALQKLRDALVGGG